MDKIESGSSGAGLSPARCDAKSERSHGREVGVYTDSWMRLPNAEVQICNLVRQLGCSCKGVDALVSGGNLPVRFHQRGHSYMSWWAYPESRGD